MYKIKLIFILLIFILKLNLIKCQQQCVQLQTCMDLAVKTANELQQYSISSNTYNALSVHSGSVQCRSLRTNFECMINFSPYCLRNEMTKNVGQFIQQAKQLLDNYCDQSSGWSNSQCYRKSEITKNCETMIPELNIGTFNYYSASIPRFVCEKYQRFRHCVYNIILSQCTPLERETFFSYLYDKTQEVSWKCANDTVFFDNYERYHPLSNLYNGNNIPQPPYIYGSNPIYNSNPFSSVYRQYPNYYDRLSYDPLSQYYSGRYPYNNYIQNSYISNNPYNSYIPNFYRSGYGSIYSGFDYPVYDEASCLERTKFLARQCEETFMQRQKEIRDLRTSNDMQKRICCSIYYYRDCLTSAILKNCRESSPTLADIIMGEGKRRELTVGCREHTYDFCNSSINLKLSFTIIILISFVQIDFFILFINYIVKH